VLVFGSLPPDARDLDLLVRSHDEDAVGNALTSAGLVRRGSKFAAFGACTGFAVEVTSASSWSLPEEEIESLFADAVPLPRATNLARPAPGHALLIIARRIAASRGRLAAKLQPRVEAAVAEDRAAWAHARLHAPAWGLDDALHVLEELQRGRTPRFPPAHARARAVASRAPRPRRPLVVALSGLDGAGKSSHASALRDTLERLDVPAAVVWTPLGQNRTLELIGRPIKKLLRRQGSVLSQPGERERAESGGNPLTGVWATFVAVLNVLAQRRALARHSVAGARVVVYDRHALDSVVRMRFLYGDAGNSRFQRWLVRTAAPTPRLAFYLHVSPKAARRRKADWTLDQLNEQARLYVEEYQRFGALRLDAEEARSVVCAAVAAAVWPAIR
jgi:thymidylate kinase